MKALHRPDLFCWSQFDEDRNLDFHSFLWRREAGNVLIDPLPLSAHDRRHLEALGGVRHVVISNSDHTRASAAIAADFDAELIGPRGERETLGVPCHRYVGAGDEIVGGLLCIELDGSKTPGELAFLLEETTLIASDLIRGHVGGKLNLLPEPKLKDGSAARDSVRKLLGFPEIGAVLVCDGWPVFRDGHARLEDLVATFV